MCYKAISVVTSICTNKQGKKLRNFSIIVSDQRSVFFFCLFDVISPGRLGQWTGRLMFVHVHPTFFPVQCIRGDNSQFLCAVHVVNIPHRHQVRRPAHQSDSIEHSSAVVVVVVVGDQSASSDQFRPTRWTNNRTIRSE